MKNYYKQFEDETVQVASLMQQLTSQKEIDDPNYVKVAVDKNMNALFFSRSAIPFHRDKTVSTCIIMNISVCMLSEKKH